jgi:hypothetical protein
VPAVAVEAAGPGFAVVVLGVWAFAVEATKPARMTDIVSKVGDFMVICIRIGRTRGTTETEHRLSRRGMALKSY